MRAFRSPHLPRSALRAAARARHRDGRLDGRDHETYRQRDLHGCHVDPRLARDA
jgi:hypothetical protein